MEQALAIGRTGDRRPRLQACGHSAGIYHSTGVEDGGEGAADLVTPDVANRRWFTSGAILDRSIFCREWIAQLDDRLLQSVSLGLRIEARSREKMKHTLTCPLCSLDLSGQPTRVSSHHMLAKSGPVCLFTNIPSPREHRIGGIARHRRTRTGLRPALYMVGPTGLEPMTSTV